MEMRLYWESCLKAFLAPALDSVVTSTVPEPGSLGLLGIGPASVGLPRRRAVRRRDSMTIPWRRVSEGFLARAAVTLAAYALVACALLPTSLLSQADAKPVTQQFQDLKITFTAAKAGDTADKIFLVLVDADGKPLSKFKVAVSADGFTTTGFSDHFELTDGAIADGSTVTLRIKSVANYNGKIGLQSASFIDQASGKVTGTGAATGGKLAGDPIYTISNDVIPSANLVVKNLFFYENHAAVNFDTLDPAVLIDATGIPEPGAVLDGPGTSQDYLVPPIADDTFFISQGQIFNDGDALPFAWFVDGYTTAVPQPPTWTLLAANMLVLWLIRRPARARR